MASAPLGRAPRGRVPRGTPLIVEVNPDHPEPRKIRRAVDALRAGELVAYPTDTAYGLGCSLGDRAAIDKLYEAKRAPRSHLFTFLCRDLGDVARYTAVDQEAYRLLRRTLPGAYTFILPATREVPKQLHSRRRTVGIRVPAHPVPQALVAELGHPILNTTCGVGDEVLIDPREIDLRFAPAIVLDGGWGDTLHTTIVDLTDRTIVREGAGPVTDLL
jgi:tRNA threonylcarbamoyl adenosine modification protein (Sua5/YciO/YrdC/YwlC family)